MHARRLWIFLILLASPLACEDDTTTTQADVTEDLSEVSDTGGESCTDGVQNQDETGVDCGGVCDPCGDASCTDGAQNQDETDVDCGGAICDACALGQSCVQPSDCADGGCEEGACVELAPGCGDGVQNGAESDVDCGGGDCPACLDGDACVGNADCESGFCDLSSNTCAGPACTDSVQNQGESDVDCGGGVCPGCPVGGACVEGGDCESGVCESGACGSASCSDGVRNQGESDVDCGGPNCSGCPSNSACERSSDCLSTQCDPETSLCVGASCSDGVINGEETYIDCGGSVCSPCRSGDACREDDDCISRICDANFCAVATCADSVQNQGESDVDCGGPNCDACADGGACNTGDDCESLVCTDELCIAPTCADSVQNQDETDVDCGGDTCDPCADGAGCVAGTDCVSNACIDGACFPGACTDTIQNPGETDVDCGGEDCPACATGDGCVEARDCQSGVCESDVCAAATCSDGVLNQGEGDVDCGGPCDACALGASCNVGSDCLTGFCVEATCREVFVSCFDLLVQRPDASSGPYTLDPDGFDSGLEPFEAYCDMETDGGGWTVLYAATGADGEEPLVSNTAAAGDPLAFEHHNLDRARKVALSEISRESLFYASDGGWLHANRPLFDANLTLPDSHVHNAVTVTSSTGERDTGANMGWSNASIAGGGDFHVTIGEVDHHNTSIYLHLNSGCARHYLYSYSTSDEDGDAGYDVNTALGAGWPVTTGCDTGEGGSLAFYAAVREPLPRSCSSLQLRYPGAASGRYRIDVDGSAGGLEPFDVYCDMETAGGGWTILYAATGADGEEALVSDTPVTGDPLAFEHHNLDRARKVALSRGANDALFVSADGGWMHVDAPLFDSRLSGAEAHAHIDVTVTSDTGEQDTAATMGWSTESIGGGGDFHVTSGHVDHHSANYRHLNTSCARHYLYSHSNADADDDAGYDVNTALGAGWPVTADCDSAEGGSLTFYAGVRTLRRSCSDIRARSTAPASGVYTVDPDGPGQGLEPFGVYCDMETAGGGWTVVYAATGADGEEALVSDTPVTGDPLAFEHHNLDRARKMALSESATTALFRASGGGWLQASGPLFGPELSVADSHVHNAVTVTSSTGERDAGANMGWSNLDISGGGDFHVTTGEVDHHNTSIYLHLNSGCARHYLYSYSNANQDGDAGYDVNTALGAGWPATTGCDSAEGGSLAFYAAEGRPQARTCAHILARHPDATSGLYSIDPDGPGQGLAPFDVVCDMETDGGGWTVVYAATGADGEEALVSDTPVTGDPLAFEHHNLDRARKMAIARASRTSIFVRSGAWLQASHALFDDRLDTADTHAHYLVRAWSSSGASDATAEMGWSNVSISGGGDFNVTDGSPDHHSTNYLHLNSGCARHYLYSYSNANQDGDAGYDVNTALGDWGVTNGCDSAEGGALAFYAGMR